MTYSDKPKSVGKISKQGFDSKVTESKRARVKFNAISDIARIPFQAHKGDAGFDLVSVEDATIDAGGRALVPTGLTLDMDENLVGLIHSRSGMALNDGVIVLNAPGVIDSGYKGELRVILYNSSNSQMTYRKGSKIAQIIFQEFVDGGMSSNGDRSDGGFGSSGVSV